jgi:hypothetical protein
MLLLVCIKGLLRIGLRAVSSLMIQELMRNGCHGRVPPRVLCVALGGEVTRISPFQVLLAALEARGDHG